MTETATLNYMDAFRYTAMWASFVNKQTTDLERNPHDFYGKLGSLDFSYSDATHVLSVWSFVMPGAGPFLTDKHEVKEALDAIAREHPAETDGATFDIRTLQWNHRASPKLEPCLWLRLDIQNNIVPTNEMAKRLDHFSTTGYNWSTVKISKVLDTYWAAHPRPHK